MKKVIVIGAGFAGLSAATHLAHKGYDVTILEKNKMAGGRAQKFEEAGFTFDMGPSWYWMPDIFENYFNFFGKKVSDYYNLIRLDPSYSVFFNDGDVMQLPAKMSELEALFEQYEVGSSEKLRTFLAEAKYKYEVGIGEFVHKPSNSIMEFADWRVLKSMFRLQMFSSISSQIRSLFKHPKLVSLLEFPVLFLGAKPQNTPALYSLMNYADMSLGTWYPMGGMFEIVKGMGSLAEEKGVKFEFNQEVKEIYAPNGIVKKVITQNADYEVDIVISGADYHHTDQVLLPEGKRNYNAEYWDKRVMAPSSLLFYIGLNKKLKGLRHHNLFFDEDFDIHAQEIYDTPKWPSKPLFYASVPSITDKSVAPEGCENLFLLIPLAPNLEDNDEMREKYYNIIMERLEKWTGQSVRDAVIYRRSFAMKDFVSEYHSFKGNAYGLANTLLQTAFLKPKLRHKAIKNMFFTGQLTTPGPGVPPSLISGHVVANEVEKSFKI
jgi:phytoene desaturase